MSAWFHSHPPPGGHQLGGEIQELAVGSRGFGHVRAEEDSVQDAAHVRVHESHVPLEGEAGDGARGVRADARQLQQRLGFGRDLPAVLLDYDARRAVQAHDPPVAAQVAPDLDRLGRGCVGERPHRREPLQEPLVERDGADHLDLLQHHLGDEHAPRISRAPPRQIPGVLPEPAGQGLAYGFDLLGVGSSRGVSWPLRHRRSLRVQQSRTSANLPTGIFSGLR